MDEAGAVAVYPVSGVLSLMAMDWNGAVDWSEALPIPSGRVRTLLWAGDGNVVVTPVVGEGQDVFRGVSPAVSLRFDPAGGTWAAAVDGCEGLEARDGSSRATRPC